ncbi:pectate lyase superfamily protein-domain-containing protein [Microdochium trichocladiopsis]|uniref:Pectate lyase superfamily protein-domain-containing protein n=1 Tax=Microdochium trichocladiopsis TaxID=1682393 RepID=A0A9P8XQ28_9PEZI|nr:pectate lyase superfamily protein-domain-containing protein [Microdochium trichocladiopsis]KAH7010780.1 pectate lyase superfamily protein-domain-containing protein [Microdochium trichocladiopsis]
MRLSQLAVLASLTIDAALGLSYGSSGPLKRSVFAEEDPPHVWAAHKFKQLEARIIPYQSHGYSHPSLLSAREQDESLPARLRNVTESDLRKAREIVEQAVEKAAVLNRKRLDNPLRNNYKLQEGTKVYGRRDNTNDAAPPLLTITDEIAEAAALVAEAEVFGDSPDPSFALTNSTEGLESRQNRGFWMERMAHQGSWPWGKNSADFKVFRNVKDYGAVGDGKTDDTKAIRKAIEDGGMCGDGCYSSTTHGAIIYFPTGTYLVSSTIEKHYGTQLIGNPNLKPVMKASKFFVGLGIFSTNKYYGDDQQDEAKQDHAWHINTARGIFWGQIRNFVIDLTGAYKKVMMTGLHYQVSQATSLQYVDFLASTDADAEQRAIFAENGSGGHMSDLTFTGGKFGIYGGNQQFTGQRITFTNVRTAVQLVWDWGWTWKSVVVDGSGTAFKLVSEDGSHGIGGALIVDSLIKNTKTAVAMFSPTRELGKGTTGLTLDNVRLENVEVLIDETSDGKSSVRTTPVEGGKKDIDLWILGRTYQNNTLGTELIQETTSGRVPELLDASNPLGLAKKPFFERAKPQYESFSTADFVSTKSAGCKGDGNSDDRSCLQAVIDDAARNGKIVFIDAGTYILGDTLHIPPGTRIVGENWAQLAATGANFGDETKPRALIRVGNPGDKGRVEMQDLIITSKGETPGALFIEWNIEAESQGAAAMWEVHVRVGGTDGSGLTSAKCPPARSGVPTGCKGGSMMMHLTRSGSAYIENAWYWVADHDLDDPTWVDNNNKMTQTSVYVARGFLVESTKPSWLYGTSSEHSVYYQYEFYQAANVLAGMIQTEQPYYQPTPPAPAPFEAALRVFRGDPGFRCTTEEPCDSGWGLRVVDSRDITILGAGLYSWFSTYTQDCLATSSCQQTMAELTGNRGKIIIHNLVTIGAVNMLRSDKQLVTAKDNQAVDFHPFWSQLSRFEAREFKNPVTAEPVLEHGDGTDPTDAIRADLASVCFKGDTCVSLLDAKASACESGYTRVGWDSADCWGANAQIICCKTSAAPSECSWRANVGDIKTDCSGRCEAGEVALFGSMPGGGLQMDSSDRCVRGEKKFCCKHRGFSALTAGCEWHRQLTCFSTKQCPAGKTSVATRVIDSGGPLGCMPTEDYCCPSDRLQLNNCHWVGQGDCEHVSCDNREMTVATGLYGDVGLGCNWQRSKSLCCRASLQEPPASCGEPLCKVEPWECPSDEGPWNEDAGEPADNEARASGVVLDKRSERRPFRVWDTANVALMIRLLARYYYGPSEAYGGVNGALPGMNPAGVRPAFNLRDCTILDEYDVATTLTNGYAGHEEDHTIDLQWAQGLLHVMLNGITMTGRDVRHLFTPIPFAAAQAFWNDQNHLLPLGMRQISATTVAADVRTVNERIFEIMGSKTNVRPFLLLESELNGVKGRIFNSRYDSKTRKLSANTNPVTDKKMRDAAAAMLATNDPFGPNGNIRFLTHLRSVLAVWRYILSDLALPIIQQTRRELREDIVAMEAASHNVASTPHNLAGFTDAFDQHDPDYWANGADHSRDWIARWYFHGIRAISDHEAAHGAHPEAVWIIAELDRILRDAMRNIWPPPPP